MSPYVHEAVAHRSKRVRFSNEPESSPPSISSDSALASTNAADDSTTNASDFGTSDSDSELSESSEEPSSDESSSEEEDDDGEDTEMELEEPQSQDGVVNLRANRGTKPIMRLGDEDLGPDIRGFLKDFLPQLKAANEELEAQKKAGTLKSLETVEGQDEGEPYIEMDLGLGVLEEKDPNADSDKDSASDAEDSDKEKDVLGKLMGREKRDPASIEVVQNTTEST
ncbi:hypothetical protein J4E83_003025 [Alternaria metachromatica]|uniref:uncharacterized protein n=1 Tax=Alternaria metachromatica TaxID=283354 RepID=UPI0020C2C47A|nr:uncharacterized protein J4E83_003025 [Alternaria metachromatica]XP_051328790.1 uncharacterized protein J4E85_003363 [Alternaria conjuncta]KAI4628475.1 hypothetical protein J4E83_003025 [Alternaria metachromatica]KAI4932960.1 hypothetical protein J4E85_003363 [Alternaria conjuncta]